MAILGGFRDVMSRTVRWFGNRANSVGQEKGRKKKRKSGPQIPDVCTENRVESMPLLELFRREGWRF